MNPVRIVSDNNVQSQDRPSFGNTLQNTAPRNSNKRENTGTNENTLDENTRRNGNIGNNHCDNCPPGQDPLPPIADPDPTPIRQGRRPCIDPSVDYDYDSHCGKNGTLSMGPRISQVLIEGKVADGNNIATDVVGTISFAGLVQNDDGTFSVGGGTEGLIYKARYDDEGELAGFDVYDHDANGEEYLTQQVQILSKTLMPDGTVLFGTNMEWTFGATASGSPSLRAEQQQEILASFPGYEWPAAS